MRDFSPRRGDHDGGNPPAGDHFAGVDLLAGVEGELHRVEGAQGGGVEEVGHQGELFDADAVLAGGGAAEVDARLEDFFRGFEDDADLRRVLVVVEEDRVDVAVAGVEDVVDGQAVAAADVAHLLQHFGEFGPRHAGVLRAVAGADAADRAERLFAGHPQLVLSGEVAGGLDVNRGVSLKNRHDLVHFVVEDDLGAVDLREEHRLHAPWNAQLEGRFDHLDHRAVEHLHRGRQVAGGDHVADGLAGVGLARERGDDDAEARAAGDEADPNAGEDAQSSLAAAEQGGQVEAAGGRVAAVGRAEGDEFAVGGDEFEAEDVAAGHEVAQDVDAAGVGGRVAADGAGALAAGVGGEVEAFTAGQAVDGVGELRIPHAGVDAGDAVFQVDVADAVHAADADDDAGHVAAREGDAPAGEARAAAAGDDRHVMFGEELDDRLDLLRRVAEGDGAGAGADEGQAVGLEHGKLRRVGQQGVWAKRLAQRPQQDVGEYGRGTVRGGEGRHWQSLAGV